MLLSFEKTNKLLADYHIRQAKHRIVLNIKEAILFSKQNQYPVVLKIFSPKIIHKTDIKGVILDIKNNESLALAWEEISKVAKKNKADIVIQKQEEGTKLILGAKQDPTFGPIIMFGLGGIFTEVLKDISFRLAPVNKKGAREMIREIKAYKILKGYRGQKEINFLKLEEILLSLSNLITKEKNIKGVDFNPVIANKQRAIVVDAKILN